MKRYISMTALLFMGIPVLIGAGREMSVQVREGALRAQPSFLAPVVREVDYGDRVDVLETRNGWSRVSGHDRQGWIHDSALTRKRIRLTAGERDAQVAASSEELALAGKGFSKEVESEFKKENRRADFTDVNRMEKIVITEAEMRRFLKKGGVTPPVGGAL